MPFCPNCNYEYVEGITVCPDCNETLVKEIDKPEEWDEKNWEVVFTSSKEYEVEMLKNNLDGAGITSTILSQKDRNFPAVGDFAIIKLMVRKEDVPAALDFIEKIKNEDQSDQPDQQEEDDS
jgi:hypothetical protein